MISLVHVDLDTFCRDPRGRVATVGPFVIWCVDATLSGLSFPPSPTMAEIQAMIAVTKRSPLPGMAPPYDIIVDDRQLTSLTSAAMTLFLGFLANEVSFVHAAVRRAIVVSPHDSVMAMVASGFGLLAPLVPGYRVVGDMRVALVACGRSDDAEEVTHAIEAALAMPSSIALASLDRFLSEHLADARLADAARALGMSERSMQRTLSGHGISFQELVDRKRQRIAEERLQAGDKADAIAADLGFASLSSFSRFFRRRVGVAPSQYRRR